VRTTMLRAVWAAFLGLTLVFSASSCKGSSRVKKAATAPMARKPVAKRPVPPPPVVLPPRLSDGSFKYAGQRYIESVTGGASQNEKLPMVVVFHGHGGNPESFVKRFEQFGLRARIIAPYGEQDGPGRYSWFPARSGRPENQAAFARVMPPITARVAAALSAIAKKRPTSGKPIVTGFSQGAHMAYGLALLHPELIGGSFAVAGEIPQQLLRSTRTQGKALPEVQGFHGDMDRTYRDGHRTVNELKRLGYAANLRTYRGRGHEFEPAAPDLYRGLERAVRIAATSGATSTRAPAAKAPNTTASRASP
jgi:phospholipase/carboxylesterase